MRAILCWAVVAGAVALGADKGQDQAKKDAKQGLHSDGGAWGIRTITKGDEKLPRVLLIGDSICNGYSKPVGEKLKGKAWVDAWVTPETVNSNNQNLKKALEQGPYDVVHFNEAGLHAWQPGRVPEGKYGELLRKYVKVIKEGAPKAKLIWASTTPMTVKDHPEQLDPEFNKVIDERNRIGLEIMKDEGVAVDDLYGLMIDKIKLMRGDRFHWKPEGVAVQVEAVAGAVSKALEK